MRVRGWIAAAATAGLALTGGLWVTGQAWAGPRDGACFEEIRALCPDVEGGRARWHCIREHADELSWECRARLAERRERMRVARQACGDDVKALCADVEPARGEIRRCLRDNRDRVSEACAALLERDDRI